MEDTEGFDDSNDQQNSVVESTPRRGRRSRVSKRGSRLTGGDTSRSNPEFQFITLTGHPGAASANPDSRRLIRAQARRATGQQHEDLAESNSLALRPKPGGNDQGAKAFTSRFRLVDPSSTKSISKSKARKNRAVVEVSVRAVPSEELEEVEEVVRYPEERLQYWIPSMPAFNGLPIPLLPSTHAILDYYHNDLRVNSFALNPEGNVWNVARLHPAVLYSFIATIGTLRVYSLGLEIDDPDILYHRMKAERLINEHFDQPGAFPTDDICNAVGVLVNREATDGSYESATVHMTGLARLIELRGGLQTLEHLPVVQRVISWADFCYAATWNRPLFFPLLESFAWPIEIYDRFITRNITESTDYGPSDLTFNRLDVLEALEQLYTLTIKIREYVPGYGNKFPIANGIYFLEHKLSSINNTGNIIRVESFDSAFDISELLALAAQLFLHLAIRETPRDAKRHRNLFDRLRVSMPPLADFSTISAPRLLVTLLMWICYVGAADTRDPSAKDFFLLSLRQLCFALNITSWEDFTDCLRETMHSELFCSIHSVEMWNAIAPSAT
ncbi:hypothetical protein BT63DRAFT_86470 [Microthyrium microscopicum]|uniref:Tachykinin family protein n=1 Tax=Microthyrium microscopicum TaxID=703497 RepID=A0A6A6U136_9PEZI|nr:hypothetical protein BT63DRAFT_86470 [Microthyrium microscopicum]